MIRFYNTLKRKKEEFKPLKDNLVRIYTCGPTVYDYAHIGNLRSYIFADVLRRTLELAGFKVKQVVNITDVGHLTSDEDEGEDKIEKGAKREHKTPQQIAEFYTQAFLSDLKKLNIEKPTIMPKATEHIKEMITMIEKIMAAGYAYENKEGIYFNTVKFKDYGLLSKQKIDLERRSRVGKVDAKKNPTDFALWLKATGKHKSHLLQWDSPWGKGFPGWHIECSAMGGKYLGDEFDIHTGGVDHIPIHHENEIAQSVAANNVVPAKFWMHGAFLLIEKEKMAKSMGNLMTLNDIEKMGFSPLEFRFMCLTNHYRSPMIFSETILNSASQAFLRIKETISRLKTAQAKKTALPKFEEHLERIRTNIKKHFFDDLNAPLAISELFLLGNYLTQDMQKISQSEAQKGLEIFKEADRVLALDLLTEKEDERVLKRVRDLADLREKAREDGKYKEADDYRVLIEKEGYKIEDLADNKYRIIKK